MVSVVGWVIGIILLLVLIVIIYYNRLIVLRNRVKNSWSQIEVQLKRRYDLIPNLVEAVKGYMKHEKGVLTEITKQRSALLTGSPEKRLKASDAISNALKTIFAVSESYPKLRASENFLQLQEELSGTENKIAYSRQALNDSVLSYNNSIQSFPGKLFASAFGFKEEQFFKTEAKERQPVKVSF